ncbi:MAG: TrmB family transcriptional regulator [Candidatus Aenigmarchaeota archaeon]|nr:TrmB family transcriptional regulator [Candidatus Aenigmarchaeota archaeon]
MVESMVNLEVMDTLRSLGLNSYERKLFVTLLAKGTSNAGTLSELSGVPRSRTYDVLESLADKGFVVIQSSKPLKYVAIDPREAMERLKSKHEENYKTMIKRIEIVKKGKTLDELEKLFKNGVKTVDPTEFTGALKGRNSMNQQMQTLIKKSKKSFSLLTSSEGLKELYENHGKLLEDAAKRGVKIKIAAPFGNINEDAVKNLKSFVEIRNMKDSKVAGRFAVSDSKEFVFALTKDSNTHPTQDLHLWSQSDHAAGDVLEPLFKMVWKNSN